MRGIRLILCGAFLTALAAACPMSAQEKPADASSLIVKAKSKPEQKWKDYETRTIDQLPGFKAGADIPLSKYGGRSDKKEQATGFFYVKQIGGRWWLIDPDGCLFIHVGVASVTPGKTAANKAALLETFKTSAGWADATAKLLGENGFNGTGAWSDNTLLRASSRPVAYTTILNLMSGFGRSKRLTTQLPGHAGYPNDCILVFHPEFEAWCDKQAQTLEATKDDPYLLGHFSDNELPAPKIEKFLALDANQADLAAGYRAAREWLDKTSGKDSSPKGLTKQQREDFTRLVWDRYFEITTKAIRKHDPHHLCLGSRFHGGDRTSPGAFQAAGKYLDVISFNYYGVWTPADATMSEWMQWSAHPVMITEWYVKGADTPLKNATGAGWIVPTQRDRGLFYQNYILALLQSRTCVGWHWFKYMDNDPDDLTTDPSNRDSNKGIVSIRYEPYAPMLDLARAVNKNVYALADYFDTKKTKGQPMPRFSISNGKFGDYDAVTLLDSSTGAKAVFARLGANLLSLHVPLAGKVVDILDGYATPEELAARKGGRAWIMAPWTNRIDDGKYEFGGATHDLGVTDPVNRVILHGLVSNVVFDLAAQKADDSMARVTFTTSVLRPGAFKGYPFSVDVSVTYTFSGKKLDVEIVGRNVGKTDAPYCSGWHPYFKPCENGINALELAIPAKTTIRPDKRMLPLPGQAAYAPLSQVAELDFGPRGKVLGTQFIDAAFTDLTADADGWIRTRLTDPATGATIRVFQERGLMHVFTGDPLPIRPRHSLAMEPVEVMTNAFNRPECRKAITLPAGAERSFRFGVEVP